MRGELIGTVSEHSIHSHIRLDSCGHSVPKTTYLEICSPTQPLWTAEVPILADRQVLKIPVNSAAL